MKFVNRTSELDLLNATRPGLTVVFGRRRIGKTALVEKWIAGKSAVYSQAIEGAQSLQIDQLVSDVHQILPEGIVPKNWSEFLAGLSLCIEPTIFVLDEFPYLVKTSPELPSLLQSWIDHKMPEDFKLVLLGSSQTMMHDVFLDSRSPLYERAGSILHLKELSYVDYCKALEIECLDLDSFENFSLVGGIPKYWELISPTLKAEVNATSLFFQKSARLEAEPDRLLRDEGISGQQARSIFESIGRGASRPSEIASRMGLHQSSLSGAMQLLTHASMVARETPFGENPEKSKKSLYKISDVALRFWYNVFSPHRSRWHLYSPEKKSLLVHEHASTVLEDIYRSFYPDAARYWEGQSIEIDSVRYDPLNIKSIIISEIKHRDLNDARRQQERNKLEDKYKRSKLSKKYDLSEIEVLDTRDVLELAMKHKT